MAYAYSPVLKFFPPPHHLPVKVHGVLKFPERLSGQKRFHGIHALGKDVLASAVQFGTHLRYEIIVEHVQNEFVGRSPAGGGGGSAAISAATVFAPTTAISTALLRTIVLVAIQAFDSFVAIVIATIPGGVVSIVVARVQLLVIDAAAVRVDAALAVDVVAVVGGGIVAVFSLSCFSWIGIAAVQ